ncbi:hypothetical protein [Enterobacter asburiae]|uniref:hypothetical protein n=1 Tax=Enterobacter asburiae TaxID=61645 RepID=UPI003BC00C01
MKITFLVVLVQHLVSYMRHRRQPEQRQPVTSIKLPLRGETPSPGPGAVLGGMALCIAVHIATVKVLDQVKILSVQPQPQRSPASGKRVSFTTLLKGIFSPPGIGPLAPFPLSPRSPNTGLKVKCHTACEQDNPAVNGPQSDNINFILLNVFVISDSGFQTAFTAWTSLLFRSPVRKKKNKETCRR